MVGQVRVHKRERILERVVVKFNIFVDKLKKKIYNYLHRPCNFSKYFRKYTEPPFAVKILLSQIRNLTTPLPSILSLLRMRTVLRTCPITVKCFALRKDD